MLHSQMFANNWQPASGEQLFLNLKIFKDRVKVPKKILLETITVVELNPDWEPKPKFN